MELVGKHILLGITGGIAAYKCCELVRLLIKAGAEVKVVMTPNAKEFVSPLVLSTLSKNKVHTEQFNYTDYDVEHISLANWADMIVIAPATANTLSKIAHGICDNLLTSIVCAFKKQILLVPAMNEGMYENALIQENMIKLSDLKFDILPAEEGFLACGVNGKGRMADLDKIIIRIKEIFEKKQNGKKILITTGGTKENIDPVRYVGNYSSGKMGIALADEAANLGFDVILISTVDVQRDYKVIKVQSADEMYNAVKKEFPNVDCLIMAAAVADFKPICTAREKIKKEGKETFVVEMVKNPDILKEMGKIKKDEQIIVGFCAETENLATNALKKLTEKNIDYIAANDISRGDIGFGSDYNEISFFSKDGSQELISRTTKSAAAKIILNKIFG